MNRTVIKFRRMIEEAIKNVVYAPAKENTVKDLISFIHFILFSKSIQNFKIYTYTLTRKYTHMHAYAYICVYTVYAYALVHIYIIIYISTAILRENRTYLQALKNILK